MKRLVKNLYEYKSVYLLKERLDKKGIEKVPGLNLVKIEIKNTKVDIFTSEARYYRFDLEELMILDEDLTHTKTEYDLFHLYNSILSSRYCNDSKKKLETLKEAEGFEIFDDIIENGGFLSNLTYDLKEDGISDYDLDILKSGISFIYENGISNISNNGKFIVNEYLNTWLEICGAKLYLFIESLDLKEKFYQLFKDVL